MRRAFIPGLLLVGALHGCRADDEGPTDVGGFGTVAGHVRDPLVDDPVEGVTVTVGDRSSLGGRMELR